MGQFFLARSTPIISVVRRKIVQGCQTWNGHSFLSNRELPHSLCKPDPSVTPEMQIPLKQVLMRGTWVAQLVKCLTLDFRSGHDLRVVIELHTGHA